MTRDDHETPELMTPAEVGQALRLDTKSITRYAKRGWLRYVQLPSGHRRYYADEVRKLLDGGGQR
jgi:predicted site-specific integrase-resolvase